MRFTILPILLLFLGCATPETRFHEVVTLDNVEVHVVSDRDLFDWQGAQENTLGYAYSNGRIFVLGKREVDGSIVPDFYWVLGHELMHLMHWKDPKFKDPDD